MVDIEKMARERDESAPMRKEAAKAVVRVNATETFSGKGRAVTEVFELKEGIVIFEYKVKDYDAKVIRGDFFVKLYNADTGSETCLVPKSIVPTRERVFRVSNNTEGFHDVESGKYFLDIIAYENWTITLEQPMAVSSQSLPQTFRGRDNKVFGPVKLMRGLVTVNCTHKGESQFGVALYESSGKEKLHIITTFESYYKGTHLINVKNSGNYYIHIFGDNRLVAN